MEFTAPDIDWAALLPLIIVFVGGLVGVAVEGFASRSYRYAVHVPLTVATLVLALVAVVVVGRDNQGVTAAGAVANDGPALLLQGLILSLSIIGVLVMSERFGGQSPDAFTQAGVSVPGSAEESLATRLGATTTEIYPLTLFSVGGCRSTSSPAWPAAGGCSPRRRR
jgi:NADH-quinone oxidoreductase subunit N